MAFVWFTPKDVLDKYPQFVPFTDFMASWNLQVRRMGEISGPLNQANRFCSAVLWSVMPVAWIGLLIGLRKHYPNGEIHLNSASHKAYMLIVCPLFCYFAFWAISSDPAENSKLGRMLFLNLIGRGFFIPFYAFGTGLLILAWLWAIQAVLRGKIVPRDSK